MKYEPSQWMETSSRRQILWLSIIVSEIASGIIVSFMSLMFHGRVTFDFVITSVVTAFFSAFLIVSIILTLLERLRTVKAKLLQNEAQLNNALHGTEVLLKEMHMNPNGIKRFLKALIWCMFPQSHGILLSGNYHDLLPLFL